MSEDKNKDKYILKEQGFTYMEVIVAFMIFGLMFVFIARLGSSIYELNRTSQIENRMYFLAELTYENYKTGINDVERFVSDTGFTIDDEEVDGDGQLISRELSISGLEDDFDITIEEHGISTNISQVLVTITSTYENIDEVTLSGQMIRDSQY